MGLLSDLKARFFPPELCRVAKRGDISATTQYLACRSVVVIGANLGESAQWDADENQIIEIAEAAAQKKSFEGDVHKFEIEGDSFLPIFTDTAAAESFCSAYVDLLGHLHAFRLFRIPGTYLHRWVSDGDILVVNSQSNHEVKVNRVDSQVIRKGLPNTTDFSEAGFLCLALPLPGVSQPVQFGPKM